MTISLKNFANRLRRNASGNVIVISALMFIPLATAVGSGVDLSRAYMAKTRLQTACDAAVLAGRKTFAAAPAGTAVSAATLAEARKYFTANWSDGTYQAPTFTITPVIETADELKLTINTSIPTTVMKVLGSQSLPVEATCVSRSTFANIDIMLVLDTTGSMDSTIGSTTRIQALRDGVLELYDTLKPVEDSFATQPAATRQRIRYGIVPYSQMTNTGDILRALNTNYIQTTSSYASKTVSCGRRSCSTSYIAPASVTHNSGWFTNYRTASSGSYPNNWDGCLEERTTVDSITSSSGLSIPTGALDLDTDTAPITTDETTKWPPADQDARNANASDDYVCPKQARPLAVMSDRNELVQYLSASSTSQPGTLGLGARSSAFVANGSTYHDIGMVWGLRLISPTGMWSATNPTTYNGWPVGRHIIFMTDGDLSISGDNYSAYGYEPYDQRVTTDGNTSTSEDNHTQRFLMLCNKAKNQGNTVWVIAFATGLTTTLQNCASSSAHAKAVTTAADLKTLFGSIGTQIGALRLRQ